MTKGLPEFGWLTSTPRGRLEPALPAAPAAARSRATDQHNLMLLAPASNALAPAAGRRWSAASPPENRDEHSRAWTARGAPDIRNISL